MKPLNLLIATIVAGVALTVAMEPAWAHKGHRSRGSVHFSFGYWGGPYWGPGYWGPAYWGPSVYPPVVVVPSEPRVYVERDATPPPAAAPSAPATPQWWYWCASARQYYPYVANCAEGWQRVAPQPQAPQ
jgi:hypothetical protein